MTGHFTVKLSSFTVCYVPVYGTPGQYGPGGAVQIFTTFGLVFFSPPNPTGPGGAAEIFLEFLLISGPEKPGPGNKSILLIDTIIPLNCRFNKSQFCFPVMADEKNSKGALSQGEEDLFGDGSSGRCVHYLEFLNNVKFLQFVIAFEKSFV